MVLFDQPNITNGISDIFIYANYATNGIFGITLLIIIFFVFFILMSSFDNSKAFAVSTWILAISAILLRLMSIIPTAVLYICVFLAILGVISLRGSQQDYG